MTSIPIYSMQTLWFPKGVCDRIDQLTRNFIWNGCTNTRSINLVNWNTVTKTKQLGGLGIRRARQTNMALIGKLVWRILNDQGGLWGNIIKHKYMQHRHGVSFDVSGRSSFVWKGITKAWDNLMEGFVWELGNGSSSFWYDSWSPLGKLCDLVPFVHISDTQL